MRIVHDPKDPSRSRAWRTLTEPLARELEHYLWRWSVYLLPPMGTCPLYHANLVDFYLWAEHTSVDECLAQLRGALRDYLAAAVASKQSVLLLLCLVMVSCCVLSTQICLPVKCKV